MQSALARLARAIDNLHQAVREDTTAAICAVPALRKSFDEAASDLDRRVSRLERQVPDVPEPLPEIPLSSPQEVLRGVAVTPRALRWFWIALAAMALISFAAGFGLGLLR
jgi:hypothetical protein